MQKHSHHSVLPAAVSMPKLTVFPNVTMLKTSQILRFTLFEIIFVELGVID
jgi:hypothetical protein